MVRADFYTKETIKPRIVSRVRSNLATRQRQSVVTQSKDR